ncbi:MAG: glycerophosphoryl diester phosphodiesterase membrane domain-containing protein [Acidobacteriaceae bacterium]|nr:glycerophosphoryl diester phosphodiesterase membrane domain-containing protein [Acidobacteriaceae bacterium]
METALRPMNTAEILDRTFSLYRNRFVLFAGIAMLPPALLLIAELLQTWLITGYAPRPGDRGHFSAVAMIAGFSAMLVGFIAYFIGIAVAQAATVFAVSAVHLGRETTIGESYGRVKGKYGRVFNVVFSVGLRVFGSALLLVLAAAFIPTAIMGRGSAGAAIAGVMFVLVALVGGVVLVLFLYSRYALAVPACVLENLKARDAIKRSVVLTAGNRGRDMIVMVLVGIITGAIMGVLVIPASLLPVMLKTAPTVLVLSMQHLATFIAATLTGAIATIALSLMYYDERVRKEAFDIQLMMAALDEPSPVQSSAAIANIG